MHKITHFSHKSTTGADLKIFCKKRNGDFPPENQAFCLRFFSFPSYAFRCARAAQMQSAIPIRPSRMSSAHSRASCTHVGFCSARLHSSSGTTTVPFGRPYSCSTSCGVICWLCEFSQIVVFCSVNFCIAWNSTAGTV